MEMTLESLGHLWINSGLTVIISDKSSLQALLNDSKLKCLEISPSRSLEGQVKLRTYTCIMSPHDNDGAFCQGIKPTQLWEIPCSLRTVSLWTAKYILETMDTSSNWPHPPGLRASNPKEVSTISYTPVDVPRLSENGATPGKWCATLSWNRCLRHWFQRNPRSKIRYAFFKTLLEKCNCNGCMFRGHMFSAKHVLLHSD